MLSLVRKSSCDRHEKKRERKDSVQVAGFQLNYASSGIVFGPFSTISGAVQHIHQIAAGYSGRAVTVNQNNLEELVVTRKRGSCGPRVKEVISVGWRRNIRDEGEDSL